MLSLTEKMARATDARQISRDYVPDLTPEADFCINHCKHKKCRGTCPEWKEFAKTLDDKQYNII